MDSGTTGRSRSFVVSWRCIADAATGGNPGATDVSIFATPQAESSANFPARPKDDPAPNPAHTRSSRKWQTAPGYADSLNLSTPLPASNQWGIPQLTTATKRHLPDTLIGYGYRARPTTPFRAAATHFFLDDYRFENVWRRPRQTLPAVQKYPFVLTPDFSLYRDWPLAAQLWNVYRSRWCGAFWQQQGLSVIPTVSWGSAESYDFCFEGIPKNSVVAVSAVGVAWRRNYLARLLFVEGFAEMMRQLQPTAVIAYGTLPPACADNSDIVQYPTRWERGRRPRNRNSSDREERRTSNKPTRH